MQRQRRQRREWTAEQEKALKTFSRQRTPLRQIASKTRRTEGALRQKAFSMGLSLGHRKRRKA